MRHLPGPVLLIALAAACNPDAPPTPAPATPEVYEIPEGWPVDGDPWASYTARAGCTAVGDNGDTYVYDEQGWPLTAEAGDLTWSESWEYERVDGLVSSSTLTETYESATFVTEYSHDEHQIVVDVRQQGELLDECRHVYHDVGLSRETRCAAPDADRDILTEYDLCGQLRTEDGPGSDPTYEVTYQSGCVLESIVENTSSNGVPITISTTYDEQGRLDGFVFDRNGDTFSVAYTWTCPG